MIKVGCFYSCLIFSDAASVSYYFTTILFNLTHFLEAVFFYHQNFYTRQVRLQSNRLHATDDLKSTWKLSKIFPCLDLMEAPEMTWADSIKLHKVLQEVRKQIGVTFPQDSV